MTQAPSVPATTPSSSDRLTLIAISALAYIIAVALHEHLGHTTACILLGGHPAEMGAFYVNCNYTGMSSLNVRLVALAGPLISLVIGLVSFLIILPRISSRAHAAYYFVWLLGSLGLMGSTGYLLFSGVSGVGDFGTASDGVFYQATPEWLWRTALTIVGITGYLLVVRFAVRKIDQHIGGESQARIRNGLRIAWTSYFTGAVLYIAIGLLNPHGFIIVAISAAASSLGGTSGLLWMMEWLDRRKRVESGLMIQRSWRWIALGVIVTIVYAAILGPTIRP